MKTGKIVLLNDDKTKIYYVVSYNEEKNKYVVTADGISFEEIYENQMNEIENLNLFTFIPKFENDSTINHSSARQIAAKILQDSPFKNRNYYDLEDHITNVLEGKESTFPELSFYVLSLRQNVETVFYSIENDLGLVDDDLDDQVMDDVIYDLMKLDDEPSTSDIIEALKFNIAYKKYVDLWYETHNEGEPACPEEFYSNEYKDENAMESMGLLKLI